MPFPREAAARELIRGLRRLRPRRGPGRPSSAGARFAAAAGRRAVLADARKCGFSDIPFLEEARQHLGTYTL
eukprot:9703612-Alexandrium_andersonii.AAC.1